MTSGSSGSSTRIEPRAPARRGARDVDGNHARGRVELSDPPSSVRSMATTTAPRPGGVLPRGVRTLRGVETVDALRRAAQDRNRITARLLRCLHDTGRAAAEGPLRPQLDRFSPDEVSAAMGWSATMSGRWLQLAEDVIVRLPAVLAAMEQGLLDEVKARTLSDWTRDLCLDHARRVCAEVLPHAPGLPVAALISRVEDLAIALDPEWAARREARARRRARVVGSVTPDGTASLSGYDLPLDEAVEALARVEAVADRVRAGGVTLPVPQLRATVYLRLLDGFGAGLDDDTLVTALIAALRDEEDGTDPPPPAAPDDRPGPDDRGPDDRGPDDRGPDDRGPDDRGPDEQGPIGGGRDDVTPDDEDDPADGADADVPGSRPTPQPRPDGEPAGEDGRAPAVDDPPPPTRGLRRGTTELRVRLSTVLGLDDHPAHIPTWGPVLAAHARTWIRDHARAEWRVVVTDDQGRLLHVVLTRHRPSRPRPPHRGGRGRSGRGIVELQVPASLLAALDPDDHPAWAALLRDVRQRLRDLPADGCPDRRPVATDAAGRRRAYAELVRWVQVRDRHCAAPGCRRPAVVCDLDHTRPWSLDGPTAAWNLGALCRRHHRLKHRGGWTLRQPAPGEFLWRTRAGQIHLRTVGAVTEPLPGPEPGAGRRRPLAPEPGRPAPHRGLRPHGGPRPRADIPGNVPDGPILVGGVPRVPVPDGDDAPPF